MPECPKKHLHTPCPDGYVQWHDWADKMGKTHDQFKCPGCQLWKVWKPKQKEKTDDKQ